MASKVTVATKSIDLGANKLLAEAALLKKQKVDIGVQADAGRYEPKNDGSKKKSGKKAKSPKLVTIAATHEFGTNKAGRNKKVKVPQRSFIRATFDEKKKEWESRTNKIVSDITIGNATAKGLLIEMGLRIQTDIQKRIKQGIPPKLKYREGTPLWDTGQLINSIRYVSSLGDEAPKI